VNWLVKEEPESYPFDALLKDGGTEWSGVKNPLAQRHLGSMREGDRVFYYHTGAERAIVGTARAAGAPFPDPADPLGRRVAVRLVPLARLPRPVPLDEIKRQPAFADHPLVRIGRLSVMPIDDRQWTLVERLAAAGPVAPTGGRRGAAGRTRAAAKHGTRRPQHKA
jgi:predicted RNA-binding protein with PUA-like domain